MRHERSYELHREQHPTISSVTCAEAPFTLKAMLNANAGVMLGERNLGGAVTDPNDPDKLSAEIIKFLHFSHSKGIKQYILSSHGNCNTIANAAKDAYFADGFNPSKLKGTELAPYKMAKRYKHARDAVENYGVDYYVNKLPFPGEIRDEQDRRLLAMEIAEGLHKYKLVKEFLAENYPEDDESQVYLLHVALRNGTNVNMLVDDQDGSHYVRLTNFDHFATNWASARCCSSGQVASVPSEHANPTETKKVRSKRRQRIRESVEHGIKRLLYGNPTKYNILEQLPEEQRKVGAQILEGAVRVHAQVRSQAYIQAAPKRFSDLVAVHEFFKVAAIEVVACAKRFHHDYLLRHEQPVELHSKQQQIYASVACVDSRLMWSDLMNVNAGIMLGARNIGGSVVDPDNHDKLSPEMEEFLHDAYFRGIREFIFSSHGNCGSIANAANDDHFSKGVDRSTLQGKELAFYNMAKQNKFVRDAVDENGVDFYVNKLSNPGEIRDDHDRRLLAMEIAEGLHKYKLVKEFFAKNYHEDKSVHVNLLHVAFRNGFNVHMLVEKSEGTSYVQLTNFKHFPSNGRSEKCCAHDHGVHGAHNHGDESKTAHAGHTSPKKPSFMSDVKAVYNLYRA